MQFNRSEYPHLDEATILAFWKILRVLNSGEVYVPTGFLFEIASHLNARRNTLSPQPQPSALTLKQVVENYLRVSMGESLSHFRELKGFPTLDSIEEAYCPSPAPKRQQSQPKLAEKGEVYNRIYKDAKTREKTLQKQQYLSLVQ